MNKIFEWFESLINPYPPEEPELQKGGLFAFIWHNTKGMHWALLTLLVLSVIISVLEAMMFQFTGLIVDWMSHIPVGELWQEKSSELIWMLVAMLIFGVTTVCAELLEDQAFAGAFPMRLRWNFHRIMLGKSYSFYQNEFAGRLSAKVLQTALAVRETVMESINIVVYALVLGVSAVVLLSQFNAYLILPFVVWFALYFVAGYYFIPKLAKYSQMQADARSMMTGRITDAYANIQTVKLFSHTSHEVGYAQEAMDEFLVTVHKQMRIITLMRMSINWLFIALLIATFGLSFHLWAKGALTIGGLAAASAFVFRLYGLSHWIMFSFARFLENIGTAQDGMRTLRTSVTVQDRADAGDLVADRGDIEFVDVDFSYDRDKPLFEDFNLHIKPGEKVGLVGRSGAGKSTLTNLLLRFFDIQDGRILIDGQDIRDVTQHSLRSQIGLVTQDTSLLHRSVRENIMYGCDKSSENEVLAAIEKASASDFIATLRDMKGRKGLDAYVGERGVKLSGGQRQRIAIARVLLKDAPILILDEATSALDSEVEAVIQENLNRLMEGKTVIAIAHRLSTIAAMDRLIVMDGGRIVEEGTHQELLERGGIYANLWNRQRGGFLDLD
ncbi:ABC transporter ATP-binding protein [Taylorella equigenitalis]|uniref:ABC transporter ATP-binding protein n=1 Tax=Taylorella equigenitalis TaxID=29575 RepID=UPI0023AE9B0F|nr:ABC transporter ATP-binding protein [Taylorella equigenitalis]WEE00390.1 ABC transporter ATP-binding protein [Taylorella equigenitalis]WEE01866.1 ABC transporter ATP-binding protein [Taylorella equigenitalis]WFD78403.1 ABC transporter ATP-binding protein [Taylorella equigenitalis]WFD79881.1 ABC transporter ATP-binding protein [Taylorella equigenitalis]WFD81357.1 ABC transporter ATP-binding protein [Taylorella equigenitalis]